MKHLLAYIGLGAFIITLSACSGVRIKNHPEWKAFFDKHRVTGCFEIYDNNKEMASYYNKERCSERMTPAATFDLFAALAALESNTAPDEQMVIRWDSLQPGGEASMVQAFRSGTTPYFTELARRIGRQKMQQLLDTVKYGNMRIDTATDAFWMNGTLRITPDEQVGFIKRLYHTELPFDERAQRIVRGMLLQEGQDDYRLYYKTATFMLGDTAACWIVGYVEQFEELKNVETQKTESIPHPYFFALNFSAVNTAPGDMPREGVALLKELLQANGIEAAGSAAGER